jgi:hypothetical protein
MLFLANSDDMQTTEFGVGITCQRTQEGIVRVRSDKWRSVLRKAHDDGRMVKIVRRPAKLDKIAEL